MDLREAGAVCLWSAEKWYFRFRVLKKEDRVDNLFFKDCVLMTLCVVMSAGSSVLFGVFTSAIRLGNFLAPKEAP